MAKFVDELLLRVRLDSSQFDREMERLKNTQRQVGVAAGSAVGQIAGNLGAGFAAGRAVAGLGAGGGSFGGLAAGAGGGFSAWASRMVANASNQNSIALRQNSLMLSTVHKGFLYLNQAINRLAQIMIINTKNFLDVNFTGDKTKDMNYLGPNYRLEAITKRLKASNKEIADSFAKIDKLNTQSFPIIKGPPPIQFDPKTGSPFPWGATGFTGKLLAFASKFKVLLGVLGGALGVAAVGVGLVVGAFAGMNAILQTSLGLIGRIASGFQQVFQIIWGLIERGAERVQQERGILMRNGPAELARMRQLSLTIPGLDFETMTRGSLQLQGAGANAAFAERAILGLSNEILRAGGTAQDLQGAIQAFAQIASKGTISAEELNQQLAERLPGLRKLLVDVFGTANAADLQRKVGAQGFITGVVDALYNRRTQVEPGLPEFVNRAKELLNGVLANLGIGLGKAFSPVINAVSNAFANLKPEYIQNIGKNIGDQFAKIIENFGGVPKIIATIIVAAQMFPEFLKNFLPLVVGFSKALIQAASWVIDGMIGLATAILNAVQTVLKVMNPLGALGVRFTDQWINKMRQDGGLDALSESFSAIKNVLAGLGTGDFDNRVKNLADQLSKELAGVGERTDEAKFELPQVQEEIARNTRQMVELQQKALELNRQILGGGTLANQAVSPYMLSKSGAYSKGWEAALVAAVRSAVLEANLSGRIARA